MFNRLIGNNFARDLLRRMLEGGRVPGALLFAGEDGVGKRQFALELAKAFNCQNPQGVEACDCCSSCKRTISFALPAPDDTDANKQILWSEHRDVGMIRPVGRAILVPQARELERETSFRPHEGRRRIFLIEDADRLNEAASNALLKTLEEVPPTSHLILLTARPASLLPTVRSRCQTIRFMPLSREEIEAYLAQHKPGEHSAVDRKLVARLARGSLGRALALEIERYRQQRERVLTILKSLGSPPDRARLLRQAEELNDAKHKDEYEQHLEALETLVHDLWLMSIDASEVEVVNEDVRDQLARLKANNLTRRAAAWLQRIEELRAQLTVNVNRKVQLDALFLQMAMEELAH